MSRRYAKSVCSAISHQLKQLAKEFPKSVKSSLADQNRKWCISTTADREEGRLVLDFSGFRVNQDLILDARFAGVLIYSM
jgi:hypothetical protein